MYSLNFLGAHIIKILSILKIKSHILSVSSFEDDEPPKSPNHQFRKLKRFSSILEFRPKYF